MSSLIRKSVAIGVNFLALLASTAALAQTREPLRPS